MLNLNSYTLGNEYLKVAAYEYVLLFCETCIAPAYLIFFSSFTDALLPFYGSLLPPAVNLTSRYMYRLSPVLEVNKYFCVMC